MYSKDEVVALAKGRWPENESMAEKLIKAIDYLRTLSRVGWAMDKRDVVLEKERRVLNTPYVGPVPITTVYTLPDEQIVPPCENVTAIPRRRAKK